MAQGLIGKKLFMHQVFTENGSLIPVTIIEVKPNIVTQVKTQIKDSYQALQLATGVKRLSLINHPLKGHLKKANVNNLTYLKEFRDMDGFEIGAKVDVSIFQPGDFVDVISISKGKGTAGVIKRHHFRRGPMSHGSKHHRAPGSIGLSRPDKVWKGQPLPGRKGNSRVTIQSLEVISIDKANNYIFIKGSIPGSNQTFCRIVQALKKTKKSQPTKLWTAPSLVKEEVKATLKPKIIEQKNQKEVITNAN